MLPLTDPHVVDPMIGRHLAAAAAGGARLSVDRGVKGVDGWAGTVRGRPRVGQSAERRRVTRAEDIAAFTAMTGDRNPLHYDEELAAASVFGRIIVQGGVTSGLLNALVAEDLPGPGTVFLAVEWKFLQGGRDRRGAHRPGRGPDRARGQADLHAGDEHPRRRRRRLPGRERDHLHGRAQSAGRLIAVVPRTRSAMLWR